MTKNIFFLIVTVILAVLTLGGLGNAAMNEPFYWVPFVVNAVIAVVLGIKEIKGVNSQIGAKKPDV